MYFTFEFLNPQKHVLVREMLTDLMCVCPAGTAAIPV